MSPLKITFDFVKRYRNMENSYMYFKNANNYFHIFPYASGRFYGKTDVFPGDGRLRNAPCPAAGNTSAKLQIFSPHQKNEGSLPRLSTGSPKFVKNFHKTLDKGGRGVL